jgi:hypothetical protein
MSILLQVHARQAVYGCVVGQAVHDSALHRSACNCCSELHMRCTGREGHCASDARFCTAAILRCDSHNALSAHCTTSHAVIDCQHCHQAVTKLSGRAVEPSADSMCMHGEVDGPANHVTESCNRRHARCCVSFFPRSASVAASSSCSAMLSESQRQHDTRSQRSLPPPRPPSDTAPTHLRAIDFNNGPCVRRTKVDNSHLTARPTPSTCWHTTL